MESLEVVKIMFIYKAPETIIMRIDNIRRNFLWGGEEGKKRMAKVSWKQVCRPKSKGGAGVVNIKIKNQALLSKWR